MKKLLLALCIVALFAQSVPGSEPTEPTPAKTVRDEVVYIIPIRGMIEPALLYVIRRGLDEARVSNASAIVFVMDTPGGTLDAASEIVRTIQALKVPSYTFVEKNAISAGAIIALSTEHIYMAPGSVIGDAMPIMMSPVGGVQEMSEDLKEKAVSAVAALIRSAAQQSGHREDVAEKMVRRELELKIDDEIISPAGQLLTLTNIEAERPSGPENRSLLSAGTVKDVDELLAKIGLDHAKQKELTVTTTERVARFIAAFAPLFLMGGLLGIYIEVRTPGFGFPGILGIVCLAIFFWGHHIAGLAGMEDLIIFAIGAILLMVEILFIPGFGAVGILGILLMIASLINSMVRRLPGGPIMPSWPQLQGPIFNIFIALFGTVAVAALVAPFLPRLPVFNRLVLAKATRREEGYAASSDTHSLVGQEGTTLSALRPGGTARFGNRKLDVITHGDFLEPGAHVRIVETHGNRIIVEAVASSGGTASKESVS